MKIQIFFLIFCLLFLVIFGDKNDKEENQMESKNDNKFIGRMLEKGRTMVHHTVKRFMVLLPIIFFKLGIAFTMLLLVTIVSVNNGFIGFLLLVVGLSSVLARLQEVRKPPVVPYINPVPVYQTRYIQDWDRKDKGVDGSIYRQHHVYPQLSGYYNQNKIVTR